MSTLNSAELIPTDREKTVSNPHRRSLLVGAGAAAILGASANGSAAQHRGHANPGLVNVAEGCVSAGQSCLSHCFDSFKAGDTSLADCAASVQDTMVVCQAIVALGSNSSAHTKTLAGACIGVCQDCEKECRKHADKHATCRKCADACAAMVREAKKLSA